MKKLAIVVLISLLFQSCFSYTRALDFSAGAVVEKQKVKINSILTNDIIFKNLILGSIIGHFSDEELTLYLKDSSELKKRILQIIKQRLQDSFILS